MLMMVKGMLIMVVSRSHLLEERSNSLRVLLARETITRLLLGRATMSVTQGNFPTSSCKKENKKTTTYSRASLIQVA